MAKEESGQLFHDIKDQLNIKSFLEHEIRPVRLLFQMLSMP